MKFLINKNKINIKIKYLKLELIQEFICFKMNFKNIVRLNF